MSLPQFSIRRPVFTTMVALMLLVLGLAALARMRIDLLPAVEVPSLTVSTKYEGADPEVVERQVTQMIEEIINTVPGVTALSSTSSEGSSRVSVTFGWGTDIDVASTDVRARLEEELSELPDDVERPQIRKFDIASFPVVLLGVSSDELDPVSLNDLVEDQIRYRFSRIEGVAQVDLWGGYAREIRVELFPDRVRALGLSLKDVTLALRDANLDLPVGALEGQRLDVILRAPAELKDLDEMRDLIIAHRSGAAIRLSQVGEVRNTYGKQDYLVRIQGKRGIRVAIRKEADANTVEVARKVLAEIKACNEAMPQIEVVPILNQGNFIERSIANVAKSVLVGGSLAVFILLFFLRSFRSTLVIAVSIPLSILATFVLVYAGGLTLNMMTLGGLALGVGMMVDSSIVVLENIYRHRREGDEGSRVSAERGSSEVSGAIMASTITTLVIFVPLVFVEGVTGMLFRELALVVVFSLLVSLIVSLSLVPMLASKISQVNQSHQGNQGQAQNQGSEMLSAFKAWADRSQTALEDRYEVALQAVLNWRLTTICLTLLLFGASLGLISQLGTEFMPPSDEGEVSIRGKFESGLKLSEADRLSHQVEEIIFGLIPEYQASVTTVSASGRRGNAESTVSLQINLGPSAQRTLSNSEVATQVSQKLLGQIPGAKMSVRAPQGQFLLERLLRSGDGIVIEVRGRDLKVLAELANRAKEAIKNIDGISDVDDDIEVGVPQINLSIDREKVADVGLSVRDVAEALEGAVRGRSVGDYRPVGDSIPLRLQLHEVEHLPLKVLLQQGLPTPSGEWVMLKHLIKTEQSSGPARILRKDQQRAVTVSVDVLNRPMGTVAKEIEQRLTEIALPVGYDMRVVGSYEEQSRAFDDLIISFLLALLLVYMVLACQYESLRDPLIVMFSVPVSAIGVLVTLFLTDTTLNLQSGIGCIMLGGIVVNNAILLVDQAKQLRQEGWLKGVAIVEAGRRRLRPILMTTATTVLGLLPLAFGVGEGADAQAPLARAVVGGLMASTMITLLLIPVIYDCFHSDQESTSSSHEDVVPEELS